MLNTSEFIGPIINRSQVSITLVTGNNTVQNRSGYNLTTFTVLVNDTENGTVVNNGNVTFWVTVDGSSFDSGFTNITDSTGHATYGFNSTCAYQVGQQIWVAGTTDNRYFDINTSNLTINLTGNLINTLLSPNGNYLRGSNVTIRVNVER